MSDMKRSTMRIRVAAISRSALHGLAVSLALVVLGPAEARSQELFERWRFELGVYGGALIADTRVGGDINKTGGERLIGRLDTGALGGGRLGVHSDLLGLDINGAFGTEAIQVRNEFGVKFPNHGESPKLFSAELLMYPFRRALLEGSLKPYVTTGAGAALLSVDLDNVGGQEQRTNFMWNAGVGLKYYFDKDEGLYADVQLRNHRVFGTRPLNDFNMQSLTVGIGFRF